MSSKTPSAALFASMSSRYVSAAELAAITAQLKALYTFVDSDAADVCPSDALIAMWQGQPDRQATSAEISACLTALKAGAKVANGGSDDIDGWPTDDQLLVLTKDTDTPGIDVVFLLKTASDASALAFWPAYAPVWVPPATIASFAHATPQSILGVAQVSDIATDDNELILVDFNATGFASGCVFTYTAGNQTGLTATGSASAHLTLKGTYADIHHFFAGLSSGTLTFSQAGAQSGPTAKFNSFAEAFAAANPTVVVATSATGVTAYTST